MKQHIKVINLKIKNWVKCAPQNLWHYPWERIPWIYLSDNWKCRKKGCQVLYPLSKFYDFVNGFLKQIKEAATTGVQWKKLFLKISQNSKENTCTWAVFLIKLQAWAKETRVKEFSKEFREIFKNTFYREHL